MSTLAYSQSKRVQNLHLTRERDRRRGRELASYLLLGLPIAFGFLLYAALHVETVRVGYAREARARHALRLTEENRRLRAELARASLSGSGLRGRGPQGAAAPAARPDPVRRGPAAGRCTARPGPRRAPAMNRIPRRRLHDPGGVPHRVGPARRRGASRSSRSRGRPATRRARSGSRSAGSRSLRIAARSGTARDGSSPSRWKPSPFTPSPRRSAASARPRARSRA